MRRVVGQITKEGPAAIFLDELQGMIGQIVNDVATATHQLAVVFEDWIEILTPVAGAESVEFLEAAGVRMIGILHAVVPLAKSSRGIAGRLEYVTNGRFIQVQTLPPGGSAVDASSRVIAGGQEFRPRGRADRTGIKSFEQGTIPGQ